MSLVSSAKMDRTAFQTCSLQDDDGEREYWQSKTHRERLEALELMRQVIYGYDPATTRLQRVLEVVSLE